MLLLEYFDYEHVASFLTLTFLEIVLAGDNLVLIAILAGKLPERQRAFARRFGLLAAVLTRLLLLFSLFYIAQLETRIEIALPGMASFAVTPRQLVFGIGGLFLVWKATMEIGAILGGHDAAIDPKKMPVWDHLFALTILQIALFDVIFSLDSVIAAIGIAKHVEVMAAAILTATAVMFFLVNPISNFIDSHPVVRLVALNFLVLVGALLMAQAFGLHVEHAYFYVALAAAILLQIVYWWLPPLGRGALLLAILALVVSRFVDLEPYIGAQAAGTLRRLADDGAAALSAAVAWLQGALTML